MSGSRRQLMSPLAGLCRCLSGRVWRLTAGLLSCASLVQAQPLVERLARAASGGDRAAGSGWLVRDTDWSGARRLPREAVWVSVGPRHSVLRAAPAALPALLESGALRWWSPPRHLLMDRARATLRLEQARAQGAGAGRGVVIGVVDSGVDAAHPDLRQPDGKTRLAYWLDFTADPAGSQPELEAALGCQPSAGLRCRVLSGADLDERLANDIVGDEPRDPIGHGTFVATIAAGGGAFGGGSEFAGVAPEATLIAARVTGAGGAIADSDVVLAAKFVFDRALELGMPAVVNLSLGSDFGARDGSSELARALAALVGPEQPGRALVVAGGNSGELHHGVAEGLAEPFGVHAEVATPAQAPLLTPPPAHGGPTTRASLFIWLDLYPASSLSVGLELPDGSRLEPVGPGETRLLESGELTVAVLHGVGDTAVLDELPALELVDLAPAPGSAVVVIDGSWPAGRGFLVEIEGRGRAELWVQSEGDLAPEAGSVGALFAGATARGTVTVPAAHPDLIAVGASVDRVTWTAHDGASVSVAALPVTPAPEVDAAAFFSSAGPNALGGFKPDLVAPGAFVISALASPADPRRGGFGIFSGGLCAGSSCQVISDGYALSAGSSMAAPMVAGAAALLLERFPSLTQPELRALLIAGSAPLPSAPDEPSREGGGVLDVAGALGAALTPPRSGAELPAAATSRLRAAAASVVADATRSLAVQLWLRDASGGVFDAEPARLRVEVAGGELRRAVERLGPGLYGFAVGAPPGAGASLVIEVALDGDELLGLSLPIEDGAVRAAARDGGGGCGVAGSRGLKMSDALFWSIACLVMGRRARRRERARNVPSGSGQVRSASRSWQRALHIFPGPSAHGRPPGVGRPWRPGD